MKLTITFKDPDGVSEAVINEVLATIPDGLDEEERDDLISSRVTKINSKLDQWLEFGEYITIEFDLENRTARILEV